jgi:hypothetical protein
MIAHPLTLPDAPLPLADLEERVREWGRDVQQRALALAWKRQAALRPDAACPHCTGVELRPAGSKPRRIETAFGPVALPRRRVRCRGCGRHHQPDDAALAPVLGQGRCTPAVRELAARCGASWPYRQAAAVLGGLRGAPISPETIRAVVEQAGGAVAAQQAAEADAACCPPAAAPDLTRPRPERLVVELDGAWLRSHDNAEGMEAKVGVVHAGGERIGRTKTRLRARRSAATLSGVARFRSLVTAAVEQRNGYEAPEQTLLGDGAEWIWRAGQRVAAEATPVLDRWHLAKARREAVRRAVADPAQRADWTARIEAVLAVGDVPGTLVVLGELTAACPHPAVEEFAAFVAAQAPRIPDYTARRAAGLPIGSGGIEKGVDVVVNRRCKGKRGMRWRRIRAEHVLALRVAELNGEWRPRLTPVLHLSAGPLPAF